MNPIESFFNYLGYMFLFYSILYSTVLIIFVLAGCISLLKQKRKKVYKSYLNTEFYLPISIIVPSFNEEKTIIESVKALINLDYNLFEIIVIDDGSSDHTSTLLIEEFDLHKVDRPIKKKLKCMDELFMYEGTYKDIKITLVKKLNGGSKADAVNMGINVSNFPYYLLVDADSILPKNAIKEIVAPVIEDDRVIAVGGSIRILNDATLKDGKPVNYHLPKKIVPAMQVVEYDRTFSSAKLFFNMIKGNAIISGAFGLFKKDIVIVCGGYDAALIGEDMELVMRLSRYCMEKGIDYEIKYVPTAVCYTSGALSLKDLKSQRKRWHIGMRQNIRKHKKMLFNIKYNTLGMISLPIFLIFEIFSPIIELCGLMGLVFSFAMETLDIIPSLIIVALYLLFGSLSSIVAYITNVEANDLKINFKDFLGIVGLCIFEFFFMHYFLLFVRLEATFTPLKYKQSWGKQRREKIDSEEGE